MSTQQSNCACTKVYVIIQSKNMQNKENIFVFLEDFKY